MPFSRPYLIFNTAILDPNQVEGSTLYDPNYISNNFNPNNPNNIFQQQDYIAEEPNYDNIYSKIDYNKYIDSMYSLDAKKKNSRANYDKNLVNQNVDLYYQTFYKDVCEIEKVKEEDFFEKPIALKNFRKNK